MDSRRIAKVTKLFTTTSDRENIVGVEKKFRLLPLDQVLFFGRKGQIDNFLKNENSAKTFTNLFYVVIPKNLACELEAMGVSLPILMQE